MSVAAELNKPNGSDSKLSVAALKEYLKDNNMTQSGDKPTLWSRCKVHARSVNLKLCVDGENPCALKPAARRKVNILLQFIYYDDILRLQREHEDKHILLLRLSDGSFLCESLTHSQHVAH